MGKIIRLFSSHPLVSDRIEMMDELSLGMGKQPILSQKISFNRKSFLQPYFLKDLTFFLVNFIFWSLLVIGIYTSWYLDLVSPKASAALASTALALLGIYLVWYAGQHIPSISPKPQSQRCLKLTKTALCSKPEFTSADPLKLREGSWDD